MAKLDKNQDASRRRFGMTDFAVDNGVSMILLTFMLLIFGFMSYNNMPKEQFPEIVIPTIFVGTTYAGNSAEDMENLISKPLEKEMASIAGIKKIEATSIQDFSNLIIEFNTNVSVEDALREVKEGIDKAKADKNFPKDLTSGPNVQEINFSEFPIMTINLSGRYSEAELRGYAEDMQTEIEKCPEISEVKLKGVSTREVRIDVDLFAMQSRQVSFGDIANAIKMENLTMSAGDRTSNGFKRSVRVIGEFKEVSEIENIIVKSPFQQPVFIRDIAKVKEGFADATSIARADGMPVVSLDVIKRAGQNLLSASDKIKKIVEVAIAKKLPKDLKLSIFNDQSINTRNQVANLQNNIISGVVLVVLVLLFFLGLRNALFVGVAIPLSMLMGIWILDLMGVTLNLIVLFSLILALGMLVDNSIVVVENIYRYMTDGYDSESASKLAVGEVAMPIIASTATTVAAFVPLLFWPGIMGEFMGYLPITLIIVLSSSLFVALVLTPVYTKYFMKIEDLSAETAPEARRRYINTGIFLAITTGFMVMAYAGGTVWAGNALLITIGLVIANLLLFRPGTRLFQAYILPAMENGYERFVNWALSGLKPIILFSSMFVLLFGSITLLGIFTPKVVFFPEGDPLYVNAFVEMPIGADIQLTNEIARKLEVRIDEAILPYKDKGVVEAVLSQIGENTADPSRPPEPGATPNKARLTVSFVSADKRNGVSTYDVMNAIREKLKGYAGVTIIVDRNESGPPTGKPINLEIFGDEIEMNDLTRVSSEVLAFLKSKNIAGIEELTQNISADVQQDLIIIDRDAARRYGISTYDIGMALRTSLFGNEVGQFKDGDDELPIMVRYSEMYRQNQDALMNQLITFRDMNTGKLVQVPIATVARVQPSSTFNAVKRKNEKRTITITSNVLEGYNGNQIVKELETFMKSYPMPENAGFRFTGEQQEQAEAMAFLSSAFMYAMALVFFIIVLQFNSLMTPLLIMTSILFSTIGVFLGYVFTGMDLVVIMTGIGIISLAGIVVNNAIVLLDYVNVLIQEEQAKTNGALTADQMRNIVVTAGRTRLRPVLLTAFTTVLGLIPLATGFNFDFGGLFMSFSPDIYWGGDNAALWGALSWTVVYGLIFATFLTLVIVPVMYWLVYRASYWLSALFAWLGSLVSSK
jgi:multidrug efflux pump subunit AcrB